MSLTRYFCLFACSLACVLRRRKKKKPTRSMCFLSLIIHAIRLFHSVFIHRFEAHVICCCSLFVVSCSADWLVGYWAISSSFQPPKMCYFSICVLNASIFPFGLRHTCVFMLWEKQNMRVKWLSKNPFRNLMGNFPSLVCAILYRWICSRRT